MNAIQQFFKNAGVTPTAEGPNEEAEAEEVQQLKKFR